MHRKTHYTETPIKPMRVYEEMNKALPRDTIYVTTIGLSQIAGAQFLHVYGPRQWINCGQAGPPGWTIPAALVEAQAMAQQYRVPVVLEVILEKVTNIAMGTEIDKINEFEDIDCRHPEGRQGLEMAGLLE